MSIRTGLIPAVAVAAIALFAPPDAAAGGSIHLGYGSYYGHGPHYGYGHSYGYGYGGYGYGGHGYGPYYGYRRHYGYRPYYGYRRYDAPPAYAEPAEEPAADSQAVQAAPGEAAEAPAAYCREYTKKIFIDGEEVTAFGTVCQQSDGSWKIVK